MTEILFATANERKIREATNTLEAYSITVKPTVVEINEIQHHDPAEITKAKARAAFALLQLPVVVSDSSWAIPALGGFPGGYMKDVNIWWSEQDWLNIMAPHTDKTIILQEHLAYCDGDKLVHFSHDYTGTFLDAPQGSRLSKNESFERVASLHAGLSLAQEQEAAINGEKKQLAHWQKFGKWLSKG
jgi:XTP/dITP diphosphohydrolase